MSKSINLFGFHSIESLLITNPESIIKVSIQSNRKDKRAVELINTLTRQKIPFFSSDRHNTFRRLRRHLPQGRSLHIPSREGSKGCVVLE